jgi:hypothetical protein
MLRAVLLCVALMTLRELPATHAKKSFYILFADQIDAPSFPSRICQNGGVGPQGRECVDGSGYSVFIASPQNMTRKHLEKVRGMVPHSRVLMYWDFGHMPLKPADPRTCSFCQGHTMGDRPGRNCTTTYHCSAPEHNPFVHALNRVFPPEYAVRKLYPANSSYTLVEGYPGLASYMWTAKSTPILHKFLSNWVKDIGFDGIYLDGYGRQTFVSDTGYDYDGDGSPDTAVQVTNLYNGWAPAFVAMMRSSLGDNAVILANSGMANTDTSLSGLTIELEGCTRKKGGGKTCGAGLGGQNMAVTAAGRESVSVLWLTHSESMSPADQCAFSEKMRNTYPFVQEGTDFFDGSHIVCNSSRSTLKGKQR